MAKDKLKALGEEDTPLEINSYTNMCAEIYFLLAFDNSFPRYKITTLIK